MKKHNIVGSEAGRERPLAYLRSGRTRSPVVTARGWLVSVLTVGVCAGLAFALLHR